MWKETPKDSGTPLDDLILDDTFPQDGSWAFSEFFLQVDAVLANGFKPSEFDLCAPEDDLSVLLAYNNRKSKMNQWEAKVKKKKQGKPKP